MSEEEVLELFKECLVGNRRVLDERETEYFWLRTQLIGWSAKEELTIDTVYSAYITVYKKHCKIIQLIEKTDKKLLLHNLQANITEKELNDILKHLYNK
ncbi:hypothetical protein NEMIN01_1683 [Nematocida minor]|uniref:uncharacterized protein n=1 Tax=Nematocida minor TaxID=1912983 RepID=UPI00221F7C28|nr:uncharacterized protein NEMIN01_1683 [Nematocida minor]KAI5191828.1 hypothetical protein NEMIN01_1683 [Nematocida minor]